MSRQMDESEKNKRKRVRIALSNVRRNNVIVYGTGIIAERVIEAVADKNTIVGIMDGSHRSGCFLGFPIISEESITEGDADLLIIASSSSNLRQIFQRVHLFCAERRITIIGSNGESMARFISDAPMEILYNRNGFDDLKEAINNSDFISFDMYDTLVMRRVLQPIDIFHLIEDELANSGIQIQGYAENRIEADKNSKGGNIGEIYRILQSCMNWDDETTEYLIKYEFETEKRMTIPRLDMIRLLNYAISIGKTVSIISDMYLPSEALREILRELGVDGIHHIFVSCEHDSYKSNGLFDVYLDCVRKKSDDRFLHIGDNIHSDIESAKKSGIRTYYVKSAYDTIRTSSVRYILGNIYSRADRFFLGYMISEVLNSPFALNESMGVFRLGDSRGFAAFHLLPAMYRYQVDLQHLLDSGAFDGILFGARDGWILKRVYDSGLFGDPKRSKSYYVHISRKAALKAALSDPGNKERINAILQDNGQAASVILAGLINDSSETNTSESDVCCEKSSRCVKTTRDGFLTYLAKKNLDMTNRYIYCDLYSNGTVQYCLEMILKNKLKGLYMANGPLLRNRKLDVECVMNTEKNRQSANMCQVNFLEKVFSSSDPSIEGFSKTGEPMFEEDSRNANEIQLMLEIHDEIIRTLSEFVNLFGNRLDVSRDFVGVVLKSMNDMIWDGKLEKLATSRLEDNMIPGLSRPVNIGYTMDQLC